MKGFVYTIEEVEHIDHARVSAAVEAMREGGWDGVDEIAEVLHYRGIENGADFADALVYHVGVGVDNLPNLRLWGLLCHWYDKGEITQLPPELKGEV